MVGDKWLGRLMLPHPLLKQGLLPPAVVTSTPPNLGGLAFPLVHEGFKQCYHLMGLRVCMPRQPSDAWLKPCQLLEG